VRQNEAELTSANVDRRDWGPTEADEETILTGLFGPPDHDGIYRGAGSVS
jgi:hypothetical protein